MTVLFLTNSIGYGGAEKMMNFVTDKLCKSGIKVVVFNMNTIPKDITDVQQKINDNVLLVNRENCESRNNLAIIKDIIRIIKNYSVDVIIGFTLFPNFYAKVASLITGIPSIMSERGDPNVTISKSVKDRILLYFVNRSRGAVFQTKEASLFYSVGLRKRGKVIPNPVFLNSDKIPVINARERNKTVVSVGRLQNIQKRMDVMLKAFNIFIKHHPEYNMIIYGSGEEEYVRDLCKELGIIDKVKLMGAIQNPIQKIYKEGMFIIASDYEGIPNALLEAMSIGLPVISTDCTPGGARLLIKNGLNGQLVPRGDYVAMANAMCSFAENPEFANQCGINARQVLTDFSEEKIGYEWVDYIKTITRFNDDN